MDNFEKTIQIRRNMSSILEEALRDAPQEMNQLLNVIGTLYQTGKMNRLWDVLAVLGGYQRGNGNSWFFTALEIQKQVKEGQK